MHADEVNETSHRRRQQPQPPGSDGFGGATRTGEGWSIKPERADQFVLGNVGYVNYWRRKLQTIRELALFSKSALSHAITRTSQSVGMIFSLERFGVLLLDIRSLYIMDAIFPGHAPGYGSSFNGTCGLLGSIILSGVWRWGD